MHVFQLYRGGGLPPGAYPGGLIPGGLSDLLILATWNKIEDTECCNLVSLKSCAVLKQEFRGHSVLDGNMHARE